MPTSPTDFDVILGKANSLGSYRRFGWDDLVVLISQEKLCL